MILQAIANLAKCQIASHFVPSKFLGYFADGVAWVLTLNLEPFLTTEDEVSRQWLLWRIRILLLLLRFVRLHCLFVQSPRILKINFFILDIACGINIYRFFNCRMDYQVLRMLAPFKFEFTHLVSLFVALLKSWIYSGPSSAKLLRYFCN